MLRVGFVASCRLTSRFTTYTYVYVQTGPIVWNNSFSLVQHHNNSERSLCSCWLYQSVCFIVLSMRGWWVVFEQAVCCTLWSWSHTCDGACLPCAAPYEHTGRMDAVYVVCKVVYKHPIWMVYLVYNEQTFCMLHGTGLRSWLCGHPFGRLERENTMHNAAKTPSTLYTGNN